MLLASRRIGVPMIIGSAGDTGTNSRVDLYVAIIRDIAAQAPARAVPSRLFLLRGRQGARPRRHSQRRCRRRLDGRPALTEAELDATDRIVGMAGVHPFLKLLDMGADVIIGGRSSDCAIFAAPASAQGVPGGRCLLPREGARMRLVLRRALRGKETVLGAHRRRRGDCHGDASQPALHGRLGCRTRDVRAVEPVLRALSPAGISI